MKTFAQLDSMLTGRCANSRKVGNNTYMERLPDGSIGIRLYGTHVVIFHASGSVTVDNGGWDTMTTRDRIDNWSPFQVSGGRINLPYPNGGAGLAFRRTATLRPVSENVWQDESTGEVLRPYTEDEKWDLYMARTMSMQPAAPGVHSARSRLDSSVYSAYRQAGNWVLSHTDRDGNCRWLYASARTLKQCKQMAYRYEQWIDAHNSAETKAAGYGRNYSTIIP